MTKVSKAAKTTKPAKVSSLDKDYNPRLSALHLENDFALWDANSLLAIKSLPCKLDVAYGPGEMETLDVFFPELAKTQRSKGMMMFIHGGYWRAMDKSRHRFIAEAITRQGYTAVIINYALCPANSIEGIVQQCLKASAWIYRNATQLNSRADNITVSGHSAGGHLAAMMMAARFDHYAPDLPGSVFKAGLSISGLYDLRPLAKAPFLRNDIQLNTPKKALHVSPISYQAPNNKLYAVYGSLEPSGFALQQTAIQKTWRNRLIANAPLKGHDHFTILSSLINPNSEMSNLLNKVLRS